MCCTQGLGECGWNECVAHQSEYGDSSAVCQLISSGKSDGSESGRNELNHCMPQHISSIDLNLNKVEIISHEIRIDLNQGQRLRVKGNL